MACISEALLNGSLSSEVNLEFSVKNICQIGGKLQILLNKPCKIYLLLLKSNKLRERVKKPIADLLAFAEIYYTVVFSVDSNRNEVAWGTWSYPSRTAIMNLTAFLNFCKSGPYSFITDPKRGPIVLAAVLANYDSKNNVVICQALAATNLQSSTSIIVVPRFERMEIRRQRS